MNVQRCDRAADQGCKRRKHRVKEPKRDDQYAKLADSMADFLLKQMKV